MTRVLSFSSFGFFQLFAWMALLWFYWLNCIRGLDLQAGRNERIILGQDTFWVLLSLHCGYSHHDAFSYAHTLFACISCANTNVLKPWHVLSTWSSHNWNPVFCIDILLLAVILTSLCERKRHLYWTNQTTFIMISGFNSKQLKL